MLRNRATETEFLARAGKPDAAPTVSFGILHFLFR